MTTGLLSVITAPPAAAYRGGEIDKHVSKLQMCR